MGYLNYINCSDSCINMKSYTPYDNIDDLLNNGEKQNIQEEKKINK